MATPAGRTKSLGRRTRGRPPPRAVDLDPKVLVVGLGIAIVRNLAPVGQSPSVEAERGIGPRPAPAAGDETTGPGHGDHRPWNHGRPDSAASSRPWRPSGLWAS